MSQGVTYNKAVATKKSHILTNTKTGERLLVYSDKRGDIHERRLSPIAVAKSKKRAKRGR